jgi:GNAT superfamily N-acetyltransferase
VSQSVIRTATPDDRARVVDTVVAAFAGDPAFHYFFRDPATFVSQATAFAGYLFDKRVALDTVWIAEDGAAVAMWDPPTKADTIAPTVTLEVSTDAMAQLDAYDAAVHGKLPTAPHWYLGVLGTHPDHAGRRLGRAVMAAGLAQAANDGVPAYLETARASNVDIYRRSGWEVTAAVAVPDLDVWVMRHPGNRGGSR